MDLILQYTDNIVSKLKISINLLMRIHSQWVISSAGNSGTEAGFYSPYSGIANWANITAPIKHNKNQLAIGALDANDNVTDFQ